jgi:NAD(P)-dependent dehydrogenase (short-subunit alcohol dehydrogenase family)
MSIFDKFSLRGKVAIVTGGNRGIGKAMAFGFAEAGAAVAVVARDAKKNQETLAELRAMGANAIAVTADVAERSNLEAMLATVTDELGPADVLVNNAGIGFHADALTLDDADWRRIFDTNLDAVWMASQIVGGQR